MKKNWYSLIICCLVTMLSACQNEDELSNSNVGYLRLTMGVDMSVNTRADGEEVYDPKQIAVQIVSEENEIMDETSNWEDWSGKQITLPVGTYTVKASSAGFDGATSGFDKPYYAGSTEITIKKNTEVNASVTCTLANVKVTVNFDQSFIYNFKSATVEVDDNADNAGISPLTFTMGESTQSGYFPVTDLKAMVTAVNKNDVSNTQTDVIENVKARDHYILNYKVDDGKGDGNVSIKFDNETKTYSYTFYIPTKPTTQLAVADANAWAKLAYLSGSVVTSEDDLEPANMKFQYRVKDAAEWTDVVAALNENTYEGKAISLEPETTYEYRMVYGQEEFVSEVKEFTTEEAIALYNGGFDVWSYGKEGETDYSQTWFAEESDKAGLGTSFWDSGNIGTSTYMTSLVGVHNPTSPVEGDEAHEIDGKTGKAAKLASQFVGFMTIGKFAAGNIYTGNYCETFANPMGARIRFGKPFVSRPIQLKGWYKYSRGTNIDEKNDKACADKLNEAGGDLCSIYIALADNIGLEADDIAPTAAFEIDNRLTADEPANFKYKNAIDFTTNNKNIVAYGELSANMAKGAADWTQFTINLEYRDLTRKPKYIIVVASASKYGDYFTGSTKSVMYVDDFELVYDGEPTYTPVVQK